IQKKLILFCVVLLVTLLVRLDALLQLALIAGYFIVGNKSNWRETAAPLLVLALTTVAILCFHRASFAHFLPHPYYQKMAGTSASERVRNGLLVFYQHASRDTLLLALISAAGLILFRTLRSPAASLLAGLFVVQCAYSIWVGGDYAEVEVDAANRFIT